LAKKLEGDSNLTGTGQILGTPSYMPPEQAAGKTDEIGPAADIYSLGAILYTLLTGRPPFQAANVMDTLLQVLEQAPVTPRQLNPQIPLDLETICLKCLEKEPHKRYATAEALANELGCYLRGEPIRARPISRPARVWRWCKRKPAVASLTAAVAICLLAGTTICTCFAIVATLEKQRTNEETAEALVEKGRADDKAADALREKKQADIEAAEAQRQAERAEWQLYPSQIAAAQRE
jgi:serine/threonine protein kinase